MLYLEQGRSTEAEPLFRRVLEVDRRKHGEEHTDTIGAMVNLATAWRDMGKLDQAEPLYRKALEIAKRAFPAGDRTTLLYVRGGYGVCLTKLERYPEFAASDEKPPRITPIMRATCDQSHERIGYLGDQGRLIGGRNRSEPATSASWAAGFLPPLLDDLLHRVANRLADGPGVRGAVSAGIG